MEPSLRALGRFDPDRARARLLDGFEPAACTVVEAEGRIVGFYVLEDRGADLFLSHLYIAHEVAGQGLGATAMKRIVSEAGGRPIRLGALKGSAANRFYQRHGFVEERRTEFDVYYVRD
ncbi:GNAT family N-acetyltransferase [Pontivivens ytuae]|uniref:GNAT family N-acetyltransferase n=2 Tax=Pontivivens ytuae TaxID=2789856 RepID=A0A7S9LVZ4_9RHOB|nr:GNAT family N-acetyltransferase [Pontivivens ytuae]